MRNGIRSLRLQTLGTWNLFQHSKHYRYGIHVLQNARGFMIIKLILEACKAKINWLRVWLALNEILLKVISRKDSSRHF